MSKTCTRCKIEKDFTEFNKEAIRKDGYYPWCKTCLRQHKADRYVKRTRKFFIENKVCSLCKEDKPRDQFRVYEGKNIKYRCISCEDEVKEQTELGNRRCGSCKKWLSLDKFYNSRRDGHHSTCKECTKLSLSLDHVREKRRDKSLQKYYGITLAQYRELLEKQNHTCPVCLKPLEGISNHVDHAHRGQHEGKIRAILHSRCNQMVMHNHYDPEELRRAANLIETPLTDWVVPTEYLKSRKKRKKRATRKLRKLRRKEIPL